MAARAFLFDLDGTLWDSFPWYASVISGEGVARFDQALAALNDGTPVARLLRSSGITQGKFQTLCAREVPEDALFPGVRDTLEALMAKGLNLGVVTSLPGWIAKPILDGLRLSGYIGVFIDYGATSRHKPHPDPLLAAMERTGLSPSPDIWYVGDTEADFLAAKNAGLSFACALYGYGFEFEGPDACLSSFADILAL